MLVVRARCVAQAGPSDRLAPCGASQQRLIFADKQLDDGTLGRQHRDVLGQRQKGQQARSGALDGTLLPDERVLQRILGPCERLVLHQRGEVQEVYCSASDRVIQPQHEPEGCPHAGVAG